jgi:hypothetical protein
MTAMNLYLAEARMLEARQTVASSGGQSIRRLFEEILQVMKGSIVPASDTRAALGDNLSRDLGLR